jgi:hypothetical protein
METLEEVVKQIQNELEVESRVSSRIKATLLREILSSQSDWQLERDVSLCASQHGWEVEKTADCFTFRRSQ